MKIRLILNPNSGHLRRDPATRRLVQAFAAARGPHVSVHPTTHPGHAVTLAAQAAADGCERVVAVGGDGTMNEVARGLIGTSAALGLVPCGSGNGLARHLGIPLQPAAALSLLERGNPRLIDVGLANGKPFLCAAGLGFEAHIAVLFNQRKRRGFLSYLLASAREWRRYRPEAYQLTAPGGPPAHLTAFTLTAANASQYGNSARIATQASVEDGQLDLVAIPPVGWRNALPLLTRLFRGRLQDDAQVRQFSGPEFRITGPFSMPFHTDGECHSPAREITFAVKSRCLRVVTPG